MKKSEFLRNAGRSMRAQSVIAAKMLGVTVELSPEETEDIAKGASLPPIADGQEWTPGLNLAGGTIVTYGGKNYQVVQGHIAQAGWEPDNTPALFAPIKGDFAEWAQPQGSHDAYMTGDKVSFGGKVWISTVDGNVWQPGVYGWEEI